MKAAWVVVMGSHRLPEAAGLLQLTDPRLYVYCLHLLLQVEQDSSAGWEVIYVTYFWIFQLKRAPRLAHDRLAGFPPSRTKQNRNLMFKLVTVA